MSESRHLRSVSDLYAADEIEVLLLEEIRDLEPPPAAYSRPEDIQDFEIVLNKKIKINNMRSTEVSNAIDLNAAGSRTGGRISSQSSELDSPGIHSTVHSWNSHTNYGNYGHDHPHGSSANAMPWPRSSHLIFYCDVQGHLKTATGLVRLLLLIRSPGLKFLESPLERWKNSISRLSSAACLATLCSSGTAKVSLFMLPLVGRLRFMIFVAVFCLLITALLLFLDISHVVYFFPFNWARLNAWIFTSVGISYTTSSALLALSVFDYHGAGWVPRRTRSQLTATAALGLSCAILSFLLSWLHGRHGSSCHAPPGEDDPTQQLYKPVDSSSSGATLKDGVRSTKQPPPWVAKNSKKHRTSMDSNNGNNKPRKDHWASARDHFLNTNQFDEELENQGTSAAADKEKDQPEPERRRQRRRRDADGSSGTGGNMTASQTKTSFSTDESKKKAPPKKLPIQSADKARPRNSKDGAKKTTTRTSVTRSEIQEYWMQGYEHVQRTDKTTANIEQWQSAAMKSLEEKKAKDERWAESWRQHKDQKEPAQPDDAKPCSSKTLEPLNFA
ncbi:hypothetical protein TSAR_006402 [Trichomalopsis sarcophagae]|uniref:MARVEL domain-containing protein n=1 Tax=Trichomalopsis sarcophagae TaxID=543379 RepID=A0A232FEF2_9HYME|nr:hypothetical protein TSAR_006402 [Trichomalopsis sarcophagae]